jgi:hypothetical protein
VAIQVEVVPLPAEGLLDDGVDHLDAEQEEAHYQDHPDRLHEVDRMRW